MLNIIDSLLHHIKAKTHFMYIAHHTSEGPACRLALDASMHLHSLHSTVIAAGDVITFNTDISPIRSGAGY